MSKGDALRDFASALSDYPRAKTLAAAAKTDPQLAAAIQRAMAQAEAEGTNRALISVLSENIGKTDLPRTRSVPEVEAPVGPRARPEREVIRDGVRSELGVMGDMPDDFVRRAHEELIPTMGGEDLIDRLGRASGGPALQVDLPNNTQAVSQASGGWGGGWGTSGDAVRGGGGWPGTVSDILPNASVRSFEVPFPESRGLVPSGERGLVPMGERGLVPQERGLIPLERGLSTIPDAPRRPRLEGPEQLRLEGPQQRRIEGPTQPALDGPGLDAGTREAYQRMADGQSVIRRGEVSEEAYADLVTQSLRRQPFIDAPGVAAERNAMDDLARAVDADAARRRIPDDGDFRLAPNQRRPGRRAAATAGGAGIIAGALGTRLALEPRQLGDGELRAATTADLAAEQNPPPAVMTQEPAPIRRPQRAKDPAPTTPPVDYSAMARDKIRQANEIQRREGRVTPESAALAREADALYRRSAEERAAGRGQPIMPSAQADDQTSAVRAEGRRMMAQNPGSDPRSQARNLLGRINAGEFGNGPHRQAAVNEVNRLFAMADAHRYGR